VYDEFMITKDFLISPIRILAARLSSLRQDLRSVAILALVCLTLAACGNQPSGSQIIYNETILSTPGETIDPLALSQDVNSVDIQAVGTAEIMHANALATLNAADATLGAAQTQQINDANLIAAQVAATVLVERANAQATLNSAGSTQSAALTQDAMRQTQAQYDLVSTFEQQKKNDIAANTQTAVANLIATQTQSALATSQWYEDQARQRQEQTQGQMSYLWKCCLPVFLFFFVVLCFWVFWRWINDLKNRQPVSVKPIEIQEQTQDKYPPIADNIVNRRFGLKKPGVQINDWMDEIKSKLIKHEKDDHDDPEF